MPKKTSSGAVVFAAITLVSCNALAEARSCVDYRIETPNILSRTELPGSASAVAVSGSVVYVADGTGGLQILDISTPSAPVRLGALSFPGFVSDVVVRGRYAYIAASLDLLIADVSTPSHPVLVGSLTIRRAATKVLVSGDRAYVMTAYDDLRIIDISIPASPALVGTLSIGSTDEYVTSFAVRGNLLFAGTLLNRLGYPTHPVRFYAIDVSQPSAPREVANMVLPLLLGDSVTDIELSADSAFLTTRYEVQIVDISDAARPFIMSRTGLVAGASAVVLADSLAYFSSMGSMRILDISDPSSPTRWGERDTFHSGTGLALAGEVVCMSAGDAGLLIISAQCGSTMSTGSHTTDSDTGDIPALSVRSNPTGSGTTLSISVPHAETITITVYDALGRPVRRLFKGPAPSHGFDLPWDGSNDQGIALPTGTYFVRLVANSGDASTRVIIAH